MEILRFFTCDSLEFCDKIGHKDWNFVIFRIYLLGIL